MYTEELIHLTVQQKHNTVKQLYSIKKIKRFKMLKKKISGRKYKLLGLGFMEMSQLLALTMGLAGVERIFKGIKM